MAVIVFGNPKGGAGKTTLATSFAGMLAQQGRNVLIVDADEQAHSAVWVALRTHKQVVPNLTCQPFAVEEEDGAEEYKELLAEIRKQATRFDDVIVDTPGHNARELRTALLAADMLIAPVGSSLFDLKAVGVLAGIVTDARQFNRALRAYLLPNKISAMNAARAAAELRDIRAAAERYPGLQLIPRGLKQRVAFADILPLGLAIEESGDAQAALEMRQAFREVSQHG